SNGGTHGYRRARDRYTVWKTVRRLSRRNTGRTPRRVPCAPQPPSHDSSFGIEFPREYFRTEKTRRGVDSLGEGCGFFERGTASARYRSAGSILRSDQDTHFDLLW